MEDITTGSTLGRYHLMSILGKGGMGEVWLAEDPLLRRQVAIKRLLLHHMEDDEYLQRFDREARAAAALHHPHILPLHDYGQQRLSDGRVIVYIVMSYVSNGSVEDRLTRLEQQGLLLPLSEAFGYLSQAAQAIDFAHQHGVLHRDIKPANMLLREDNTLLLADFGLARLTADADTDNLTHKSMLIGTPKYMAPEQAQGQAVASSDIYSLAVLAYRCFTGRYPFNADTVYATIVQHAIGTPTAPRLFNPELSVPFEEVLLRGLAKDPAQRPSSATLFVEQLQHSMHESSVVDHNHLSPPVSVPSLEGGELAGTLPPAQAVNQRSTISRRALLAGAGVLVAGSGLTALVFSPPGRALFAPTKIATAGPHQASTGAQVTTADAPVTQIQAAFSKPAVQLAWSPVSSTLAGLGGDGQMVLWNIQAGQTLPPQPTSQHLFKNNGYGTNSVKLAWSPSGNMVALSNGGDYNDPPNAVLVYKSNLSGLATGFATNTITSKQPTLGICWVPGRYILVLEAVIGNMNQLTLRVYDPKQPQRALPRATIALNEGIGLSAVPLALSPNGSLLAVGGTTSDYRTGVLVGKLAISDTQVDWHPQPLLQTRADMGIIAWSPDGRYLAGAALSDVKDGVLYIWDATRGYQALNPPLDPTTLSGQINSMAWSASATRPQIAVGSSSGKIYLWDIKAGSSPVRVLPGITGSVTSLDWSHDGQWLAASYDDNADSVLIWRVGNTHG
jgi:eukaryotic-like serine/threonine-protein kinase